MLYSVGMCFIFFAFYPLLFHVNEWAEQEKFRNIRVVWFLTMMNGYVVKSTN